MPQLKYAKVRRGNVKMVRDPTAPSIMRKSTTGGALKLIPDGDASASKVTSHHIQSGHKKYTSAGLSEDTNLERLRDSLKKMQITPSAGSKKKYIRF